MQYQWDKSLEDGMLEILEQMDQSELVDIRGGITGSSELWQKLLELESLASSSCCFEGMREVIEFINGSDSEDRTDEDESHNIDEGDEADELDEVGRTETREENGDSENH